MSRHGCSIGRRHAKEDDQEVQHHAGQSKRQRHVAGVVLGAIGELRTRVGGVLRRRQRDRAHSATTRIRQPLDDGLLVRSQVARERRVLAGRIDQTRELMLRQLLGARSDPIARPLRAKERTETERESEDGQDGHDGQRQRWHLSPSPSHDRHGQDGQERRRSLRLVEDGSAHQSDHRQVDHSRKPRLLLQ